MDTPNAQLEHLFDFLSYSLETVETSFYKVPGSHVVARYVKSSHQNDPGRTILEVILVIFVIRTLLQSRTRTDRTGKHFIQYSEKEIDELVDDWEPEPLAPSLTSTQQAELDTVPVIAGSNGPRPKLANSNKTVLNLASINFTGLSGNEEVQASSIETLRKYGLGSCGPPGFYGTVDTHTKLEQDIAEFLNTESAILYSQGYSTISSVIPSFCKRGDVIVADRGVNFSIQKGLQISRSTIRWYDHNDLASLESVLELVEKERKKRKQPLTRRFIVTEGIFEKDGAMVDLPKLIQLKLKYKFRLILDESYSFGSVGRTGRGLTELYNVPASSVDMLVGSVAIGLSAGGGFCAGSRVVTEYQRGNGVSFVFSASQPPLLSVSGSVAIGILRETPSVLESLRENIRTARNVLDKVEGITIPSHPASPIIHVYLRTPTSSDPSSLHPSTATTIHNSLKPSNPTSIVPRNPVEFDIESEERMLQEIVEECLAQGVLVTRAKRLRGQEMIEAKPSIRLAMTSALSKRETEKAVGVVKAAIKKVLGKRR